MADRTFSDHMSDSDALMWNIEKDPLLRSTIVTVLFLDRAPDWDALVRRVEAGTRVIPRLRQRVATPMLRIDPPSRGRVIEASIHVGNLKSFLFPLPLVGRGKGWGFFRVSKIFLFFFFVFFLHLQEHAVFLEGLHKLYPIHYR